MIEIKRLTKYLPKELSSFKGAKDLYLAVHIGDEKHLYPLVSILNAEKLKQEWKNFYNSLPYIVNNDVINAIAIQPITKEDFVRDVSSWMNAPWNGGFNAAHGDCERLTTTLLVTDYHVMSALLFKGNFVKNLSPDVKHFGQSLQSLIRTVLYLYFIDLYEAVYVNALAGTLDIKTAIMADRLFNQIATSLRDKVIGLISRGILFHAPMNTIWIESEFYNMMRDKGFSPREQKILLNWKNVSLTKKLRSQDV